MRVMFSLLLAAATLIVLLPSLFSNMASVDRTEQTNTKSSTPVRIAMTVQEAVVETFKYLNEAEIKHGQYSVIRHSRPFVLYQGVNTFVPISICGPRPLSSDARIFLQRRGYRTGLLGWTFGGLIGGSKLPGIDVTPASSEQWTNPKTLSTKQQDSIDKDIQRLFTHPRTETSDSSASPKSHLLKTLLIRIPVRSGDGYFRLRVTSPDARQTIAEGPVFRVGSLTWASAHPQGATPLGLVPELGARSAFIAAKTAAWAAFYTSFPILKFAEWVPGLSGWSRRAIDWAYVSAGGDAKRQELDERLKVSETWKRANDRMYKEVPFGAAGIRTLADLVADDKNGQGGVAYDRTNTK